MEMTTQIEEKESQIRDIEQQMLDITNYVQQMVLLFNNSHFYLNIASHQEYDAGVKFNENNVTTYLSELEEYISCLITYLAQREKDPSAPISALGLDGMILKEFDKGPLTVDAKTFQDFDGMENDTDIGDGEIITDPVAKMRQLEEQFKKGLFDDGKR